MAIHDDSSQRLFVEADLASGMPVETTEAQANYLLRVLRLGPGDAVLVFNGRDGEWQATVEPVGKRQCRLVPQHRRRPQSGGPDVVYLFAPLKRARLDYMVQKAVELGVAALQPVITRRTIAERVNLDRMRANAIEAAEQCGVLWVPDILEPAGLEAVLGGWEPGRRLVFADEAAAQTSPITALSALTPGPLAVLVGPEGGFSPDERKRLLGLPFVTPISLGPRIMRADTAAVAVLALVMATLGDW